MKINPDRSNSVQFIIQSVRSKSVRTALTKLIPEQFTVLLGTGNKFQVGGVLVAVKILLSVGSIISLKKDCLKMCNRLKKKVPDVRRFWWQWNFYKLFEALCPSKRLPQNMWLSQQSKVPEEVLVAMQISLSVESTFSPQERLPQNVWTSVHSH